MSINYVRVRIKHLRLKIVHIINRENLMVKLILVLLFEAGFRSLQNKQYAMSIW